MNIRQTIKLALAIVAFITATASQNHASTRMNAVHHESLSAIHSGNVANALRSFHGNTRTQTLSRSNIAASSG